MAFFNDMMASMYLVVLFLLTDQVSTFRDQFGWTLAILIIFTVSVNLCKFLYIKTKAIKNFIKNKRERANDRVVKIINIISEQSDKKKEAKQREE